MGVNNRYKGTCSSNAALVNKYVGTAYDHVKTVSDNIEDVKVVADALGDDFPDEGLDILVENIDDIVTNAENISDINTVAGIKDEVITVAGIEQEIIDVPSYTAQAIDAANAAEEDADRAETEADRATEQADLAANIADPYKGLWPDVGGGADKGDVFQTQVGGVGTGHYFTALQNTTVYPVGDDVNWREVVSNQSLGGVTNYQAASVADMINGVVVGGSTVDSAIASQVFDIKGSKFQLKQEGIPTSIYDYNAFNEIHAEAMGVIADYYLTDGSVNPTPTDNKDALRFLTEVASTYDGLNVLRKKIKSRILLPSGGVATSEPWVLTGGGTYADNGVAVDSIGYKTDIIKTTGGNGNAPVDSVIYLAQPSSTQAFACTNVSIKNLRLISNDADYGVTSQNDVTFFNSENVNMELGKAGAIGYYWPEFFYVNKIITGHLSCVGRAFVMTRSGTTNVLDNLFAFGCQDGPWKIACVYSNIGSLAADNCSGVMYDLSFSSATTFASLGSESPNATAIIGAGLGTQVTIQSVYFQNAESMVGNIVSCGDGCSIEINKLNGYSTTETEQIVPGLRLANVGINARCIIKDYKGFYKFGQRDIIGSSHSTLEVGSGDFGAKNNTIQREDGIHYLGQGRQEYADWYSDAPVVRPKTIFMNHGANAATLNDGSSVQFSGAGLTKGDLIPLDDFDNTGEAILIVKSAGSDFNSSTYEIIQATKTVQTLAELPTTNLWAGRDVKVIDEKKIYTYYPASAGDPAGWYDASGVIA